MRINLYLIIAALFCSVLYANAQPDNAALKNDDSIIVHLKVSDQTFKADTPPEEQEAIIAQQIKHEIDSLRATDEGAPVVLFKDTLFYIHEHIGPFSPAERANSIQQKVNELAHQKDFDSTLFSIQQKDLVYTLNYGETAILSITQRDAIWEKTTQKKLANTYQSQLLKAVVTDRNNSNFWENVKRILLLFGSLFLLFFLLRFLNKSFTKMNDNIVEKGKDYFKGIRIKNYELLSVEREALIIRQLLRLIKWFFIILIVYLTLPTVFSIFPATRGFAEKLFGYVLNPFKNFINGILGYIPELITIAVILLITRYVIRLLKFLSKEVDSGKLMVSGFYSEWAIPTYNILKIIIYAFAFIIIFPYLPGSESPVFQGVSVFFGLLISLGSSSAISNIIAGLVIIYMRAFKIGDRVKIGDTVGDVIEKSMLVTRIRTIKNEEVAIPNSSILNGSTINYSANEKEKGLILSSTVTIGYDIPWRKVHELLIDAAKKTANLHHSPEPFVLQTSLDDFYVSYQINAYTGKVGISAKTYSELHSHIQDAFNAAGIEIMSPHYRAARDGNQSTVPAENIPKNYQAPSFQVQVKNEKPDTSSDQK